MTEQEKEPKFYHSNYGEIEYHRIGNKLWYSYKEEDIKRAESGATSRRTYEAKGLIPDEIIAQGDKVVKEFVRIQVDEKVNAEKEDDRQRTEHRERLRHPLELVYEEVLLKGQIRSSDGTVLTAELLEPYQGEKHLSFGFASAMSGHYIYSKGGFSDYAVKRAEGILVEVYQEEKDKVENSELDDLAKRLFLERRWKKNE